MPQFEDEHVNETVLPQISEVSPTIVPRSSPLASTSSPPPVLVNPSAVIKFDSVANLASLATLNIGSSSDLINLSFSRDGSLLGGAFWDGNVYLWDIATFQEISSLSGPENRWQQVFSPSGQQMLLAREIENTVQIWDLSKEEFLFSLDGILFLGGPAISNDGKTFATLHSGQTEIALWDLASEERVQILKGDWSEKIFNSPFGVLFSPDDSLLVADISDGSIIIWDVDSGERIKKIQADRAFAFSSDQELLAIRLEDGQISIIDTYTWQQVEIISIENTFFEDVKFSLEDELLILDTDDGMIIFWHWKTGSIINTVFDESINLLLSPDGTLLLPYSDWSEEIRFWGIPE